MGKKHLAQLVEFGGLAFLGGMSVYLVRKNEYLEKEVNDLRAKFLKNVKKVDLLKKTLQITHKKYMNLKDNLKEHVELMLDVKNQKGWIDDANILTEKFPEKDLQLLAPDILIAKLSGLMDAFILNKWSITPPENKKIKKSMLSNGSSLDIYSKNDLKLVLDILMKIDFIKNIEHEFILKFYDYYKEKIIIKGDLPKEYNHQDIEYFFDFTIDMILKN